MFPIAALRLQLWTFSAGQIDLGILNAPAAA